MTNNSPMMAQPGPLQKNAFKMSPATASAAESTRVTMIAIRAGRLPWRAGTRDSSVMSPRTAMPKLAVREAGLA